MLFRGAWMPSMIVLRITSIIMMLEHNVDVTIVPISNRNGLSAARQPNALSVDTAVSAVPAADASLERACNLDAPMRAAGGDISPSLSLPRSVSDLTASRGFTNLVAISDHAYRSSLLLLHAR